MAFIVEMARLASAMEDHPLPPADDPALVRGLPPSPDTAVLALDHEDRPVGAAWWHFRDRPLVVTPGGAQVPELVVAVTPSDRGRGVGRALLDALTTRAAEHGYDRVALNVHIRNPAARLYSRAGFVVAGKGRGPLGVAMVRQLVTRVHGPRGRRSHAEPQEAAVRPQRRARAIAMTADELDAFLTEQRTCRVATAGSTGPHVTPLWFAWHGGAVWLTSLSRSQRWTDLQRDPRVAVVVDAGEAYGELRGVELRGRVEVVGEVPRTGEPNPELEAVEQHFADRYTGGVVERDGRHAWLRLVADKVVSWDFRKLPADRR